MALIVGQVVRVRVAAVIDTADASVGQVFDEDTNQWTDLVWIDLANSSGGVSHSLHVGPDAQATGGGVHSAQPRFASRPDDPRKSGVANQPRELPSLPLEDQWTGVFPRTI